jgi:hypothetical protein
LWPYWSPSFFKFAISAARKDQIVRRGLLDLLDEPMKDQNAARTDIRSRWAACGKWERKPP